MTCDVYLSDVIIWNAFLSFRNLWDFSKGLILLFANPETYLNEA